MWFRTLFTRVGIRLRLSLEHHLPHWPDSFLHAIPAGNPADALVVELRRHGFRVLFDETGNNHRPAIRAGHRSSGHLIVARAATFTATETDRSAAAILDCAQWLQQQEIDPFFGKERPAIHRVLLVTCRSSRAAPDRTTRWIEEFFARVPRSPSPGKSAIWNNLALLARGSRPIRTRLPIAEVIDEHDYRAHWLGAVVWNKRND